MKQTSVLTGQTWIVDSQTDWAASVADPSDLECNDGLATPTATEATIRSVFIRSDTNRSAKSLTIDQSLVWHDRESIPDFGPSNLGDAPAGCGFQIERNHRERMTWSFVE